MTYFGLFRGYIVTANADGSVPINSLVVAKASEVNETLLQTLIDNANAYAKASREGEGS